MPAKRPQAHPGTPVVVGPRAAKAEAVQAARAALDRWVSCAGEVVAGAGIDLGEGLRSARVEGGAGDRRDGVLAALAVPGLAPLLGDRVGVVVALFGPAATKPLGAAAQAAVDEQRWPALRFAVAASDVLGPEQLTELVKLRAPDGVDPFPQGLPSLVGRYLTQVLSACASARRLRLLTDLWDQVCADGLRRRRQQRLRASQSRRSRTDDLLSRYARHEEDELRAQLRSELGASATFVQIALWHPSAAYWLTRANRVLHDALAATVLARVAVTAFDRGVDEAVRAHRAEIDAAVAGFSDREAADSARAVAGLTGLPARPTSCLRDLRRRADRGSRTASQRRTFDLSRLAHARDYGALMLEVGEHLLHQIRRENGQAAEPSLAAWARQPLTQWRDRVGFLSPQRLQTWDQTPLLTGDEHQMPPLSQRQQQEMIGDLFWFAELADALAQLNGHPAAIWRRGYVIPRFDIDAPAPRDPLIPTTESIALAAASVAQLLELGGQVPRRCRSWPELVSGVIQTVSIAEALTGNFAVPAEIAAADGTVLPGSDLRVQVARNRRHLADWADYMGNCIAGPHYVSAATEGHAALLALRTPEGAIVANVELRRAKPGWRVDEMETRFNMGVGRQLRLRVGEWTKTLVRVAPEPEAPSHTIRERAQRTRPRTSARLPRELAASLQEHLIRELGRPSTVRSMQTMARVAARTSGVVPHTEPGPALTALRRVAVSTLARAVEQSLRADLSGLTDLWKATAERPLQRAIAALPPAGAQRLQPLLLDAPLPGSLRPLSRMTHIASARTGHLVALRLRQALSVLIGRDNPEIARAITSGPDRGLILAAVIAVTSHGGRGGVTAISRPGGPESLGHASSSLDDDLWQSAMPDAVELGATPDRFWEHVAAHGALVPTSWIPQSWPVLWARAVTMMSS